MKKFFNILLSTVITANFSALAGSCKNSKNSTNTENKKLDTAKKTNLAVNDIKLKINSLDEVNTKVKLFAKVKSKVTHYLNWQYNLGIRDKDFTLKTKNEVTKKLTKEYIESLEFYLEVKPEFILENKTIDSTFKVKVELSNNLSKENKPEHKVDELNPSIPQKPIKDPDKQVNIPTNKPNEPDELVKDSKLDISKIDTIPIFVGLQYENSKYNLEDLRKTFNEQFIHHLSNKYKVDLYNSDYHVDFPDNLDKELDKKQLANLKIGVRAAENSSLITGKLEVVPLDINVDYPGVYFGSLHAKESISGNKKNDYVEFNLTDKLPKDAKNIKVKKVVVKAITDREAANVVAEVDEKYYNNINKILNSKDKSFTIISARHGQRCGGFGCTHQDSYIWVPEWGWGEDEKVGILKEIWGKVNGKYVSIDMDFTYKLNE